jgi:hypothetical protein
MAALIAGEIPAVARYINGEAALNPLNALDAPPAEPAAEEPDEDPSPSIEPNPPRAPAPAWGADVTLTGCPIAEAALAWVAREFCSSLTTRVAWAISWAAAAMIVGNENGR